MSFLAVAARQQLTAPVGALGEATEPGYAAARYRTTKPSNPAGAGGTFAWWLV